MRLGCIVVTCALAATGCGYTQNSESAVTGGPSSILPLELACVSDAPGDFGVEPRNGNAYLSWTAVAGANVYEVEIYEVSSGSLVAGHVLAGTQWEWGAPGLGQGPYRARVRALAECGSGRWSADDVFILNRSGAAGVPPPSFPPPPVPGPEAPPTPAPPSTPVAACGSLSGAYAADFRDVTFRSSVGAMRAITVPAGVYRIDVETYDAGHAAGRQPQQTHETVSVSVRTMGGRVEQIGTTQDIPEAAAAIVSSFSVSLEGVSEVHLKSAGGDSVHGACVAWSRK